MEWYDEYKVTLVVAAGNSAEKHLHETVPQKLETADNGVITVGGIVEDGSLFLDTTLGEPGQAGSLSVFAPAKDIIVEAPGDNMHTGTSQAAAITVSRLSYKVCSTLILSKSGLAAYLYSAPNVGMMFHPDVPSPDVNMKKFIMAHAWTRVLRERLSGQPNLNVIYNLARGDPAHSESPCTYPEPDPPRDEGSGKEKRAEPMSACLLSLSSVAMNTSTVSPISSRYV